MDIEALMATFSEDCSYSIPTMGLYLKGKDQIRAYYLNAFESISRFQNAESEWFEAGDDVFLKFRIVGQHVGPFGHLPASGNELDVRGIAHFPRADDGKLAGEHVYFGIEMLSQLGVKSLSDLIPPTQ